MLRNSQDNKRIAANSGSLLAAPIWLRWALIAAVEGAVGSGPHQ
jgi:hypothetical protein